MPITPKTIPIAGFKGGQINGIQTIDDVKKVFNKIVSDLDYMFRHVRDDMVQIETHLPIRTFTTASSSSLTPEPDSYDMYCLTALAANMAINNHSTSSPAQGKKLIIRIKDDGTIRNLTYGTYYRSTCPTALPAATKASKVIYLGFIWNSTETKWDLVAVSEEA